METTTDISAGYPCGHHGSAEYVTTRSHGPDTVLDVYRCDTCGEPFGVVCSDH